MRLALLAVLSVLVPAALAAPAWSCTHTTICLDGFPNVCTRVCARGSVRVDAAYTAAADRLWASSRALPPWRAVVPATHNSAIAAADGYGVWDAWASSALRTQVVTANQGLSLLDQVTALKVTQVELDVHYHHGGLKLCHAGGIHSAAIDKAVKAAARFLHVPIDWDTETIGCFGTPPGKPGPKERNLTQGLDDLAAGLAANPDRFYVVYLDVDPDLEAWGVVHELVSAIATTFTSPALLTPPAASASGFGASTAYTTLLAAGHRILFVSRVRFPSASHLLFDRQASVLWPAGWVEAAPKVAPCSKDFPANTTRRVVPDSSVYGPFYSGPARRGVTDLVKYGQGCGWAFPCADHATPDRLKRLFAGAG